MSKAKTASKNNPSSRESAKEFFCKGRKIRPVKLVTSKSTFLAAEYDDSGEVVVGTDNNPVPWGKAKHLA